jgi:iron complex transport system permease protein
MRYRLTIAALVVLLIMLAGLGLLAGHGSLSEQSTRDVFLSLRAVRFGCAALAGAALAVAGVLAQGLFRNPLADPSLIGTTAGANLGGQLALLAHAAWIGALAISPEMMLPLGCLIGAGVSLAILLAVVGREGGVVGVVLAGFILSSLFASVGALLATIAQDRWELGRAMLNFTLGTVSGKSLRHLVMAAPLVVIGLGAAWAWGRPLDLLLSGEDEAAALGVDVRRVRRWVLAWTAVLTGAAVAIGGAVAFVGLVVPHALRPLVGVGHRRLVIAAALGGACYVAACDIAVRATPWFNDMPLGVITGLIGAPVFLALFVRARRGGEW